MEQVFLAIVILALSAIMFFISLFLYKKSPKIAFIPPISTSILVVIIILFARTADGWDGLVYAIFGMLIALATILSGIALLIYHFIKKSQQ